MLKDKTFDYMFFGFLTIFGLTLIIGCVFILKPKKAEANWEMTKDARQKMENEVFGVEPETDFEPKYYDDLYVYNPEIPLSEREQMEIQKIAYSYNICPELIFAIIERESTFKADAENGSCKGIMQINVNVHDIENPFDLIENVEVGTKYLAELFGKYEDLDLVLMKYHGESDAENKWERGEMSKYAEYIITRSAELERQAGK